MDQLQMIVEALRQAGANGGMVAGAANQLQAGNQRNQQAADAMMQQQAPQDPGMQAPPMQQAGAPGPDGLTPLQRYQLQQAQQQIPR